jgi:superfamily I DNA and/or RNA helicase
MTDTFKYKKDYFGFVSPYAGQIQLLKEKLEPLDMATQVRSIDSWQGREKEIIVFSAVRCNFAGHIGFLEKENRINVALTRAQHGLIIVGNV